MNLIACPTCGRTRIDLIPMAEEVERRLMNCTKNITVAVMGCAVNGPGEAAAADIGIAGGKGEGLIFRKGEILYKVPQEQLVDKLMEEIEKTPMRNEKLGIRNCCVPPLVGQCSYVRRCRTPEFLIPNF